VWNCWVNNYLVGRKSPAFDILSWNADTTRMPARPHADFVTVVMDNALVTPGATTVLELPVDLSRVEVDAYLVARDRRSADAVAELLPQHPTARRGEPVRAVDERPYRRAGQPVGNLRPATR